MSAIDFSTLLDDQGEPVWGAGQVLPVPLEKAYRLINQGPTVLVSAQYEGVVNVMAASWACGLDFAPAKVTVVLDKSAATRTLVTGSGYFALQVPTVDQLQLTYEVGNRSLADDPDKLRHCAVRWVQVPGFAPPLVAGCAAWLICRVIPEPHNQQTYDLFIGEVVGAWADSRVFRDGHWQFEQAAPELRSLHYIAGGQFYAIGQALHADTGE